MRVSSKSSRKLVDAALVEYLKQKGFEEPAPKR